MISTQQARSSALERAGRILFLFLALIAHGCAQLPTTKPQGESEYYAGKLGIRKATGLSPQAREVEARFAYYLEEKTEEAIALYRKHFGKEINTDSARELSKDYAPGGINARDAKTKAARATWSAAVQEPSGSLAREIYRRELRKPAARDELDRVVFTAGGAGVGKTTSIKQVPGLVRAVDSAQIVYDTTLSNWNSAVERITEALDAGKTVSIIFIYRDPVNSFVDGALPRAENDGRTLPIDVFVATHLGASSVVLRLAERYKDESRVEIAVIDNTRRLGEAVVTNIDFVKGVAGKYTVDGLKQKLVELLEEAHEKGKRGEKGGISEVVYRGFKGPVP